MFSSGQRCELIRIKRGGQDAETLGGGRRFEMARGNRSREFHCQEQRGKRMNKWVSMFGLPGSFPRVSNVQGENRAIVDCLDRTLCKFAVG